MKVGYNFDYFISVQSSFHRFPFELTNALLSIRINFPLFIEVRGITNRKTVIEGYENVQAALLDYTLTCYADVTVSCGSRNTLTRSRNNLTLSNELSLLSLSG